MARRECERVPRTTAHNVCFERPRGCGKGHLVCSRAAAPRIECTRCLACSLCHLESRRPFLALQSVTPMPSGRRPSSRATGCPGRCASRASHQIWSRLLAQWTGHQPEHRRERQEVFVNTNRVHARHGSSALTSSLCHGSIILLRFGGLDGDRKPGTRTSLHSAVARSTSG